MLPITALQVHFSSHTVITPLSVCPSVLKVGMSLFISISPVSSMLSGTCGKTHMSPPTLSGDRRNRFSINENYIQNQIHWQIYFHKLKQNSEKKEFWKALKFFFFLLWFSKSENYLGGILNDFKVKKWETLLVSCNQHSAMCNHKKL